MRTDVFHPLATLTTARLRLVPLGPEHLDGVLAWVNDPESARLTGTRGTFTSEQVETHLARVATADDRADWAIIREADGVNLGEVVLNDLSVDDETMNVRIGLAPGHPGNGYGTEAMRAVLDWAFDVAGLHRVELEVYAFNPRAQRSYEKSGFVLEGRRRDAMLWDGERVDAIVMSVLSTDPR